LSQALVSESVFQAEKFLGGEGAWFRGGLWADHVVGFDRVHIRCCGNGCLRLRPYGGSLWKSPKVTKGLLPHHSVPRLGSVCPNEGLNPWAAVMGRLRSRSKARAKAEQKQSKSRAKADRVLADMWRSKCGRGLAPDEDGSVIHGLNDSPLSGASRIVAPPLPHF
jgi:hypothetical protein